MRAAPGSGGKWRVVNSSGGAVERGTLALQGSDCQTDASHVYPLSERQDASETVTFAAGTPLLATEEGPRSCPQTRKPSCLEKEGRDAQR